MSNIMRHQGEKDGGISAIVWKGLALEHLRSGIGGYLYEDEFDWYIAASRYVLTQATAGTFAQDATAEGGVCLANAGSTTTRQGPNLQATGAGIKLSADSLVALEARVKLTANTTAPHFLLGLFEVDTTLVASSLLTSGGIGFSSLVDANKISAVCATASYAANTFVDSGKTFAVADQPWIQLGLRVEHGVARFYIDGDKVAEINTNLPASTVLLVPSLVVQSGGTTQPIVAIDWLKAAKSAWR